MRSLKGVLPGMKRFLDLQMRALQLGGHRVRATKATSASVSGLPDPQQISSWAARFASHHEEYVTSVSTREMAASLRCLAFCVAMCENRKVTRILDAGSGFSSF